MTAKKKTTIEVWEVEQSPRNELLMRCSCGGEHFISLSADTLTFTEEEEYIELSFTETWRAEDVSLWGRLKAVWALLRKSRYESTCVELNRAMVTQVKDWCDELLSHPVVEKEI